MEPGEMNPDLGAPSPQDNLAHRFPVSVKGVVFQGNKVVLLKNERDEWELPGGKLEPGENPEACLVREIEEELGLRVDVEDLLDAWVYHISAGVDALILTYGCCSVTSSVITHSSEHKGVGLFTTEDTRELRMPDGYKRSIEAWRTQSEPLSL